MHNANLAQESAFKLILTNDLVHTEFFVQQFSGLGMSFSDAGGIENWFGHRVRRPGDELTFNEISLTVIIDEELEVLEELYNTMAAGTRDITTSTIDWNNIFNASLQLKTNRNNLQKTIHFENCWIQSIGDLSYTATQGESTPITSSVTLVYDAYTIESVSE